jgi:hypothetical protein
MLSKQNLDKFPLPYWIIKNKWEKKLKQLYYYLPRLNGLLENSSNFIKINNNAYSKKF